MAEESNRFTACYVVVIGNEPGKRIGLVKLNEDGYYPCKGYDYAPHTEAEVRACVDALNDKLGVPKNIAQSMFEGSMFGWHTPAAAVAIGFWNGRAAVSS